MSSVQEVLAQTKEEPKQTWWNPASWVRHYQYMHEVVSKLMVTAEVVDIHDRSYTASVKPYIVAHEHVIKFLLPDGRWFTNTHHGYGPCKQFEAGKAVAVAVFTRRNGEWDAQVFDK